MSFEGFINLLDKDLKVTFDSFSYKERKKERRNKTNYKMRCFQIIREGRRINFIAKALKDKTNVGLALLKREEERKKEEEREKEGCWIKFNKNNSLFYAFIEGTTTKKE